MTTTLAPVGLTARRKQRTRDQLAAVAAQMFLERGYETTTVEEVAAVVEVSPRTVFRYFRDKEDLFMAFGQLNWDAFLERLAARPPAESPLVAVTRAIEEALAPRWENGQRVRAFMTALADVPALRARWVETGYASQSLLADVLADRSGAVPGGLEGLVVAGAIVGAINTGLIVWASEATAAGPRESVDRAVALLARPLLAHAPLAHAPLAHFPLSDPERSS